MYCAAAAVEMTAAILATESAYSQGMIKRGSALLDSEAAKIKTPVAFWKDSLQVSVGLHDYVFLNVLSSVDLYQSEVFSHSRLHRRRLGPHM
jgi:hypothetical protein